MKFSNIFFLNRPWHRSTTDNRSEEFLDGRIPSNHSTYGICECKHAILITPKGKKFTRWKSGERGVHGTYPKREMMLPGKHVSNNDHWLVSSVCCGTILLKPHFGTVYSSSTQSWAHKVCKMSGSRGSLGIFTLLFHFVRNPFSTLNVCVR
jgi:hypothetical protein